MRLKNHKKGQVLENFGQLALGVATFAIILVIAFLMMDQTKDVSLGFISSTNFSNQTTTITPGTASTINMACVDEQAASVTQVLNNSRSLIPAVNYTVIGKTINVDPGWASGTLVNITYTCLYSSVGINATKELQGATDDLPGWIPLIIIVIIGGTILVMVQRFRQ